MCMYICSYDSLEGIPMNIIDSTVPDLEGKQH